MNWAAEPYWQIWDTQMALIAQATAAAPDPQLTADAAVLTRLLLGQTRAAQGNALGALRHGARHWKKRR